MKKYKLALVGSGSLGGIIGELVLNTLSDNYDLLGILSGKKDNAFKLAKKLNCKAYETLEEMIEDRPDFIIEAASPNVVKDMAMKIIGNGINLIPLSVGAFADEEFYKKIEKKAKDSNVRIYIPSGAVGGFDVLRAALLMEDGQVTINTEKSPKSLNGAPFLNGRKLSEESVEEIFSGSAKEAIELFPKNVNVAVATALATVGVDNTLATITSLPNAKSNRHEIELIGDTIKVNVVIESTPSPNNPKSSSLAAYSVIALLKNLISPIVF